MQDRITIARQVHEEAARRAGGDPTTYMVEARTLALLHEHTHIVGELEDGRPCYHFTFYHDNSILKVPMIA